MDEGFIGGNKNILLYLVVGSFAIYMLISALNIIKEKVRVEIVAKVQYSLWHQAYEHLMRMKINYFDDRNAAEIFNNLSVDIANMVSVADESAFFVVTQAFSMVGGVIGLFILDYRMTILVLLFISLRYCKSCLCMEASWAGVLSVYFFSMNAPRFCCSISHL